ncbi:MAG: hypothetical protein ABW171_01530, partial [Steroidobacter sp.]
SAVAASTESTLLLTAYGQLWDAEVTSRLVSEGTLRFCYLLQSRESFKQRHQEYAHDLFQILLLKDHRKATELLRVLPDPESDRWRPLREMLLSEEKVAQMSAGINPGEKRALETKWGFTGLIAELSRSGDPIFSGFTGLLYGYSLASHIQHADSIGIAIRLERDLREPERRDALHAAHQARLISDVLASMKMRLFVGYRFIDGDRQALDAASRRINDLLKELGSVYQDWMDCEYRSRAERD